MRIAVDAHAIGRHLTGNEVYVRSLLNGFAAAKDRECEFLAYVSSEEACGSLPAGIRTSSISTNPFLRLGCELSMKLRRDRPDLLHVQYTAPVVCAVPVVVSVHDVSFLEHPEYFTGGRARQLRWTVRRTVDRAAKVLTVSEFSRRAILRVYGHLDEDKVVVAPNAAGAEFRPVSRQSAQAAVSKRFSLNRPFLLSVGDLQPRKNQIGLIRAFGTGPRLPAAWPRPGAGRETHLVCGSGAGRGARIGRLRSHPHAGFCIGCGPAPALQRLRRLRFPVFLRGFWIAAA